MGTGLARSVCEYFDGSICADLSYIIQAGLTLVYVAAAHYSGAVPEDLPTKRHIDVPQDYIGLWETTLLSSDDISYDSLTPLAFQSDNATLTRRQGGPALVHRLQVTGFTLGNSPKHDIIANHYDNGDTVLQVPLPGGNSVANGAVGAPAPISISDSISPGSELPSPPGKDRSSPRPTRSLWLLQGLLHGLSMRITPAAR